MNLSNHKKLIISLCLALLLISLSSYIRLSYIKSQKEVDDYLEGSAAMSRLQEADFGLAYMDTFSDIHGSIEGNYYSNTNLGFSLVIPDGYTTLSEDNLQNYIDSYELNRWAYGNNIGIREADLQIDDSRLRVENQYYDLLCINEDGQIISVNFLYDPLSLHISDYIINLTINESQKEFSNNPQIECATHDDPFSSELNGHEVYLVNWTITKTDGSIYFRTEIIDFVTPILRVIAIDYDASSSFEDISSSISYFEPETTTTEETSST